MSSGPHGVNPQRKRPAGALRETVGTMQGRPQAWVTRTDKLLVLSAMQPRAPFWTQKPSDGNRRSARRPGSQPGRGTVGWSTSMPSEAGAGVPDLAGCEVS